MLRSSSDLGRRSSRETAQLLAPAATARKAEPVACEQPSRSQSRVDQVTLTSPPLLATRPLALPNRDSSTLEEADEPGPIAAGTLDRERGQAEPHRPGK